MGFHGFSWGLMGFNGVEYIMVIQWTWVSYVGAHLPWCTFGFMGDLTPMTVCSQLIRCPPRWLGGTTLPLGADRSQGPTQGSSVYSMELVWVQYVETRMFPIMVFIGKLSPNVSEILFHLPSNIWFISMYPNCSIEFDGLCSIIQTIMQWFGCTCWKLIHIALSIDEKCLLRNRRRSWVYQPQDVSGPSSKLLKKSLKKLQPVLPDFWHCNVDLIDLHLSLPLP